MLKYYSNVSAFEFEVMPIAKRDWWLKRLQEEISRSNGSGGGQEQTASPARAKELQAMKAFTKHL